jgi:hypothetical protein
MTCTLPEQDMQESLLLTLLLEFYNTTKTQYSIPNLTSKVYCLETHVQLLKNAMLRVLRKIHIIIINSCTTMDFYLIIVSTILSLFALLITILLSALLKGRESMLTSKN